MQRFLVVLRVAEDKLPLILDTIRGSCELVETKAEAVAPPRRKPRYMNGRKNKGVSGESLLIELVTAYGRIHEDDLRSKFVERGFAPASASSTATKMRSAGLVERDPAGYWHLKNVNGAAHVEIA